MRSKSINLLIPFSLLFLSATSFGQAMSLKQALAKSMKDKAHATAEYSKKHISNLATDKELAVQVMAYKPTDVDEPKINKPRRAVANKRRKPVGNAAPKVKAAEPAVEEESLNLEDYDYE